MKHFAELQNNKLIQILHTEIPPSPREGYSYIELSAEEVSNISWVCPFPKSYQTVEDGKVVWKNVLTQEEQLEYQKQKVRDKRDILLKDTDWSQLPDVPLNLQQKYLNYRQELRDLSLQPGFPNNVIWPEKPQ